MSLHADVEASPSEKLKELSHSGHKETLAEFIDSLGGREAIHAIFRLDPEDRDVVLRNLSPAEAADFIEEIPDELAADLIERLPAAEAAAIVTELRSDDRADVLGDMDEQSAEKILGELEPEDAERIRQLTSYPDDVAGGLMATEYLAFDKKVMVGAAAEKIAQVSGLSDEPADEQAYVISAAAALVGAVTLNDLVLADQSTPLSAMMETVPSLSGDASIDDVRAVFEEHEVPAVPVVDEHNRIIGVVSHEALLEAIAERADIDQLKSRGIVSGDEIRTMPLMLRSRRRLSWLSVNIVLNVMAASVIALYEETLTAVIALAVFLPIVSDMSGCSGNQAVAVSLRELTLGVIKPFEVIRVWIKEVSVGIVNGLALGVLLGAAAWLWKGNPYLGVVVGGALWLNTIVAVSVGGVVPLVLKRFGVDPAIASGPILTTVTDMFGFFLVLSFAAAMLPLLLVP